MFTILIGKDVIVVRDSALGLAAKLPSSAYHFSFFGKERKLGFQKKETCGDVAKACNCLRG